MLDPARSPSTRPLVLCIDDDEVIVSTMRHYFEQDGYDVATAGDGTAARRHLSDGPPADLVVLDSEFPPEGLTFCRELKSTPGWEDVPILIETDQSDEQSLAAVFQAGASDFVSRPLSWDVVRHRVRRLVRSRQAESRLDAYESRVAGLLALIDEAILAYDEDERIESFTPSAVRMFGLSAANAIGNAVQSLFLDPLPPSTDEIAYETLRARRADGAQFIADVSIHRVRDRGKLLTLLVVRDATQRAIAERERQLLADRLRQSRQQESLATLSGGVAHDLNSVLTAILGFTEAAREAVASDPVAAEHLSQAEASVQRARRLVNQLLAYAGRAKPDLRATDLNRLLLDLPGPAAAALGHYPRLDLTPHPGPVQILADADQIGYALVQLVANGVEAAGHGAPVIVRIGREHIDSQSIADAQVNRDLAAGEYAFVEVYDSGPGMRKEVLDRALEPFFTTRPTSRGLGLSVVAGIVKAHGGALRIQSSPGAGTSARFWLPLTSVHVPSPAAPSYSRFPAGTRVLIVDDEDLVRAVLKAMLERKGCEVLTASHGGEAVDLVRQEGGRFDAVLLDLNMPVMDGERTLEELSRGGYELPVWIMTGYDPGDREERIAARKVRGILRKPLSSETLFQTLAAGISS